MSAAFPRVLHIINGLDIGGAEMMLVKLLTAAPKLRQGAGVIGLSGEGPLATPLREFGIPVHMLGMRGSWPSGALLGPLRRFVRAHRPEVIQGWLFQGSLVAQWSALWSSPPRAPTLWNIRQTTKRLSDEKPATALTMRLLARLSSRPVGIIYNSKAGARDHERIGFCPAKTVIVPNGFDTLAFRPQAEARAWLRDELGLPPQALLVGMVARMDPLKDHTSFLQAAAQIAGRQPLIHFVLVGAGTGPANAALHGQITALGLERRVHGLGQRCDVGRIMAGLDLATLTSIREGFPNAVGEAMACAIPCVVTDAGAAAELVGDTGIVVPTCDSRALARGWLEGFERGIEWRRVAGLRARARIVGHFSIEATAATYLALYAAAAGSRA